MAERHRLPGRRGHWLVEFQHAGFRFIGGYGRFDDGTLAEIFLNASARSGTAVEAAARDAAVTASIAFQSGADPRAIRDAITRDETGAAAGPLGRFLDLLHEEGAL